MEMVDQIYEDEQKTIISQENQSRETEEETPSQSGEKTQKLDKLGQQPGFCGNEDHLNPRFFGETGFFWLSSKAVSTFWQRSLLMQGLGWLGGIGLLGSSIVWVQNQDTSSAIASPNIPEIMPKAVSDVPVPPPTRQEPVFIRRTPNPSPNRVRNRSQNRVTQSTGNGNTSSYIDPTDYSIGATDRQGVARRGYQPPNAVVFSERYNNRRRRVIREEFSVEEPSGEVAAVRPRRRRDTVTVRRRDSTGNDQISRAPRRSYETERQTRDDDINPAPRNREIARRSRSYQISRATRNTEVDASQGRSRSYQISRATRNTEVDTSERRSRSYQISRATRNTEVDASERRSRSYQISRATRNTEVDASERRSRSYQISRATRNTEVDASEGRSRSYQISRAPRKFDIERVEPSQEIARLPKERSQEKVSQTTAREIRRRGVSVASIGRVKISPVNPTANDIKTNSPTQVIRRNDSTIKSASEPVADQNPPNPVLNYYYNSTKPSDTGDSADQTNLALNFPLAIPAQITSVFGWRIHTLTGERGFHAGTDIGAPMGTPVLAAHAGRVAIANFLGGYGLAVVLRHNQDNQETRYGHLSEISVKPGDWVETGTVIGRVGDSGNSNGPQLYFEVREQTPQGWVAKNPATQIEYSLARLINAFQRGQATLPQDPQPYELPPNTLQLEDLMPKIPVPNAELPILRLPRTMAPPPLFSTGD